MVDFSKVWGPVQHEIRVYEVKLAAKLDEFKYYRKLGETGPVAHQARVLRHCLHYLRTEDKLREELRVAVQSNNNRSTPEGVQARMLLATGHRVHYSLLLRLLEGMQGLPHLPFRPAIDGNTAARMRQELQAAATRHQILRQAHPYPPTAYFMAK